MTDEQREQLYEAWQTKRDDINWRLALSAQERPLVTHWNELHAMWLDEGLYDDDDEWRDELSEEDKSLVMSWDRTYATGMRRLIDRILEADHRLRRPAAGKK
jgi:hypothetical protein